MYIDKMVKKDVIFLIISVIFILVLLIGVSYSYFFSIDKGKNNIINIGNLEITFCIDETCNKNYPNFGQVIGTKNINGESVVESIYPYLNDTDALNKTPYIFNIKNTGTLDSYLTIKLNEDKDYIPHDNYKDYKSITELYSNNIKIGISNCSNQIDRDNVSIIKYSEMIDNIILTNDTLNKGETKTYCFWTWLDNNTPNTIGNNYFVANLDL